MFKKIGYKFFVVSKTKFWHYTPKQQSFVHKNVPFFAQWESSQLAEQILTGKIKAIDDPNWKKSGAESKLEYLNWSWSACGMACFQMVLAHLKGTKIPLIKLCKLSLKYGCFQMNKAAYQKGEYLESLPGMYYKPFVDFAKKEFGIGSKVVSPLVLDEIIKELDQTNFVIASVAGSIRHPNTKNVFKGGHLVLMLGYDLTKKIFFLHNPSGFYKKSQEYAQISFNDFKKFFDNRGIVIYS